MPPIPGRRCPHPSILSPPWINRTAHPASLASKRDLVASSIREFHPCPTSSCGLKCRLCGKPYPKTALNFCTDDFGPLEVDYDYEAVARTLTKAADRAAAEDDVALPRAAAARRRADRRPPRRRHPADPGRPPGRRPSASPSSTSRTTPSTHPTLSFKDRVVAVALSQGRRVRLHDRRLRLDRQPRQQRRRQRRRGRARSLHPDPRRPGDRRRSSAPASTAPR